MTYLNLTKDPILMLLLQNIVRGASRISIHDMALNQKVEELKQAMQSPTNVSYPTLTGTVDRLASILRGYELPKDTGETPGETNQVGSLPSALFHFKERLEELKTQTELNNKHFSLAEIEVITNRYIKLAKGE